VNLHHVAATFDLCLKTFSTYCLYTIVIQLAALLKTARSKQ